MDEAINNNAVSLYGENEAMDDFPVLKAFQQYIDAEQAKSRKRMLSLCIFFGVLMAVVVSVFVLLVINVTTRNQALNDRLVEFAMKERDRVPASAPVVVQPTPSVDNTAIIALTTRLEEMQKKLVESEANAKKIAADSEEKTRQAALAAAEAAKPKAPSAQELEIARLRAQLADEAKKAAEEKERLRQAELEAYRRKHYPECYAQPQQKHVRGSRPVTPVRDEQEIDMDDVDDAISYFDEDDESSTVQVQKRSGRRPALPDKPDRKEEIKKDDAAVNRVSSTSNEVIDVQLNGSTSSWRIPQ